MQDAAQTHDHAPDQSADQTIADTRGRLLDAILPHVPFDGWSQASFLAAITDSGLDPALARALCPRGAIDLAADFHKRGDAQMLARLAASDLSAMRFRERVTAAVRWRLEAVTPHQEAVRRAATLFALPQHAAQGARLIWGTSDAVWRALGDRSDDLNWYTKRATLSAVYASTVLYWLGDQSEGQSATWAFLDRRIENVMAMETAKARLRDNRFWSRIMAGPASLAGRVRAPGTRPDMPGGFRRR